jgi:hypothetical protein
MYSDGRCLRQKAWDLKMDRETRFIPTDIESIPCRRCKGKARLIQREPLPANVVGEMLTFKCEKCDKELKTIVQG